MYIMDTHNKSNTTCKFNQQQIQTIQEHTQQNTLPTKQNVQYTIKQQIQKHAPHIPHPPNIYIYIYMHTHNTNINKTK